MFITFSFEEPTRYEKPMVRAMVEIPPRPTHVIQMPVVGYSTNVFRLTTMNSGLRLTQVQCLLDSCSGVRTHSDGREVMLRKI